MKIFVSSALAAAALVAPTQAALPASVTSLMDTSVSPCTDFYQYSCGGWLKANPLGPSDTGNDASFSVVSDNNEIVIQNILKEDWPLLGEFWDSCMDFKTQDALGAKPLQPGLQDIYRAGSKIELFKAAGKLSRTGFNLVTAFDVAGDQRNAKTNGIYIGNSDPTISINTLLSPTKFKKIEADFRKYITTILTLANFNPNTAAQGGQQGSAPAPVSATYFGDAVIKVEQAIASLQLQIADQDGDDAYYHKLSLTEAAAKYPLTIGAYFQGSGILNTVPKGQEGIFYFFDYFELAEKLLASIDIKDLKTYVAYLYINNRTRYLGNAFYNAYFDFFGKVINGQAARSSDASICTYRVQQYFPDLIGKYYFMKVFDQVKQDNADSMIAAIKEAMGEHIKNLSWLDNATRLEAAGKLAKVLDLIGQSKVKQSYPFVVGRDTYFDNVNTIAVDTWTKKIKKIGYTVDRNLWDMSAAEVNAYYSPLENKMVFPAAILQPPFFDASAHSAKNYGAIGAIMGHELTHGFDSSGRNYDGDGTQRNWWTDSTAAEFESRANCMKKQYSGFVVNGANGKPLINIEGNRTITENIADNGGFSLTWDAFHKYQASPKYEAKGLTPAEADQLIFLSFAQTWCGHQNDASIVSQVTGDPHSIGQWRANGVAMNSDHFGPTFNCAAGTPMNPVKKCQIW